MVEEYVVFRQPSDYVTNTKVHCDLVFENDYEQEVVHESR